MRVYRTGSTVCRHIVCTRVLCVGYTVCTGGTECETHCVHRRYFVWVGHTVFTAREGRVGGAGGGGGGGGC